MTPPPQNPLTRLLAVVIAVLVLAGVFTLGLVALAIAVGLGVVFGLFAWVRNRFFTPKKAAKPRQAGTDSEPGKRRQPDVIEAEYTVVARDTDDRRDGD